MSGIANVLKEKWPYEHTDQHFFILHGLVHLLYAGQATRFFELSPGLTWPDGSWLFSRLLGDAARRWLATIALVVAALSFLAGGLGLFFGVDWRQSVLC